MSVNDGGTDFVPRLTEIAASTEALLDRLLSSAPMPAERARPGRLIESMRYAALGGGKRFRPFLVVESAALFAVPRERSLMAAAALECVHCYSLVHDDLPAMDNDDLRRGRPTAHKAFDEATAILAGDSLLTFAFDILSRTETHPDPAIRIALVQALARASGLGGMAGGQMLDLAAEGRFDQAPPRLGLAEVEELQAMKTGALLRFGCLAGAILGGARDSERAALDRFGAIIGEAFQIADDILDVEGDPRDGRQGDRQGRRCAQGDRRRHSRRRARQAEAVRPDRRGRGDIGAVRAPCRHAQGCRPLRRRTAGVTDQRIIQEIAT